MEAAGFLNENEPKDEDNLKVKKKQAGAELCQAQGKLKLARLLLDIYLLWLTNMV